MHACFVGRPVPDGLELHLVEGVVGGGDVAERVRLRVPQERRQSLIGHYVYTYELIRRTLGLGSTHRVWRV